MTIPKQIETPHVIFPCLILRNVKKKIYTFAKVVIVVDNHTSRYVNLLNYIIMNFKQFIPDFGAIAKTDWAKPQFDTTNIVKLVGIIASVIMLIFVFCPWFGMSSGSESDVRLGITLWYGIFAFLTTCVVIASFLYDYKALAFWTSVVCILFAIIGLLSWPDLNVHGVEVPGDFIKISTSLAEQFGKKVSIVRWGAIMYLISSLVTGAAAFANTIEFKFKK